jgi:DNA-3-methyladenine glycosylase
MNPGRPLPEAFYLADTVDVARSLLGCVLWRRNGATLSGVRIVETEAYLGANDSASHARRGLRSPRNESMYLRGGHAYVYFTYGMHFCVNVVTQEEDVAEAVLLRAGEPVEGIELLRSNRGGRHSDTSLANGPAKLCQALAIDRTLDGVSLRGRELFITARYLDVPEGEIAVSPRIGVENSGEAAWWPLRFYLRDSPFVSKAVVRQRRRP